MRLCHLIMCHKNPDQLRRLVNAISSPNSDVYVHLDKKEDISEFEMAVGGEATRFIANRKSVNWGGFSFVKSIMASLDEIKGKGKTYDFINLISGQDYPIKPIGEFETFLEENRGKCFISFEDTQEKIWWSENKTRVTRYHFNDFSIKGKYLAQRAVNFVLPERNFPKDWMIYGGDCSSWWTLSADAAYYLADTLRAERKLRKFASFTWGSDEYIYATILMNSKFSRQVVNNNYRYIDWRERKPNPKILLVDDFEKFQGTDNFFARKFDLSTDPKILDMVDEHLKAVH